MNKDLETKKFEIEKSYITKEEFINIINNIEFIAIKKCDLDLVTGFILHIEDEEVTPLYKTINLC